MFSSPNDKCGQTSRAFPSLKVPGDPGAGDSLGEDPCGTSAVTAGLCLAAEERSPCADAQLGSVVLAGGELIASSASQGASVLISSRDCWRAGGCPGLTGL